MAFYRKEERIQRNGQNRGGPRMGTGVKGRLVSVFPNPCLCHAHKVTSYGSEWEVE
jgi:hypothetical protein